MIKKHTDTTNTPLPAITFSKLVWLYILGSLSGVVLEGTFCIFKYGHWETHVVSMIGPLCIIYGFGSVLCYVGHVFLHKRNIWLQFAVYSIVGALLELLCGLLLEFGLSMRAWDYTRQFLNIRGHVSLQMTLAWGVVGISFSRLVPYIENFLCKLDAPFWKTLSIILAVVLVLDLVVTSAALYRWSNRHFGAPAANTLEEFLDNKYDDTFMEHRFCEWRFLEPRP